MLFALHDLEYENWTGVGKKLKLDYTRRAGGPVGAIVWRCPKKR